MMMAAAAGSDCGGLRRKQSVLLVEAFWVRGAVLGFAAHGLLSMVSLRIMVCWAWFACFTGHHGLLSVVCIILMGVIACCAVCVCITGCLG